MTGILPLMGTAYWISRFASVIWSGSVVELQRPPLIKVQVYEVVGVMFVSYLVRNDWRSDF